MPAIVPRGLALALVSALLALAAAGCGGGDDGEQTGTTAQRGGPGSGSLGPAEAQESVEEAEERIADAVASDDCDTVNELNLISRPSLDTPERCESLRRLDGLESTAAQEYGEAGAVIDYERGPRTVSAVLVRDSDGLLHVAFINAFNEDESVGTRYARQFDAAAEQALKALEQRDCVAYREVLWVRFGRGAADKQVICDYVENNPVANLLEAQPDAEFERAGGNGAYAFYTLGTPAVNLTFVLARQSDRGAPAEADPLPEDAGEYVLVDAYRTNDRAATE